ncbi:Uncharacterised protein [Brucella anthropi]|nr:Uncharacterised protein [Brucella anthropi]
MVKTVGGVVITLFEAYRVINPEQITAPTARTCHVEECVEICGDTCDSWSVRKRCRGMRPPIGGPTAYLGLWISDLVATLLSIIHCIFGVHVAVRF